MDVGGGNGILLVEILKAHTKLRGFLGGGLTERSGMQDCDFFREVPSGCRAYVMKNVLVDWNDEQACAILLNCRRAISENGALVVVDFSAPEDNLPSRAKLADLAMLVLTGGSVRTIRDYRDLLARGGFRLNKVIPVPGELSIIEALPG